MGTDKHGKKTAKLTTKFYEPNSFSLLEGSQETNVREMFRFSTCMARIWSRPTFMAGLNHLWTDPGGTWFFTS
ncbi:MAG: hypothetical protein ACTIAV_02475 [Lactobacillus delbrueckii]